jgi:putative redox protein
MIEYWTMVEIQIAYEGDLRCHAVHGPSGSTILTDAPVDNMGKGEAFSPTDLVATALGSCMMTIMGIAANRLGIDLRGMTARVIKEMSATPPRRIARLAVKIRVPGTLSEEQKQKLHNAAMTCPVHKSLHPDVEAPVEFIWD